MKMEQGQVILLLDQMLVQFYKGDQSMRSFGPIVWNDMLPGRLKACQSLSEFKTNIKSWVPDNCPCKLCKTYIPGLGYTNVVGK